jgi:hypothetical protein
MPNLNDFAKMVTLAEGKKISISIAQVKEVIRIVLLELALMPESEALRMIGRYCPKSKKAKPRKK